MNRPRHDRDRGEDGFALRAQRVLEPAAWMETLFDRVQQALDEHESADLTEMARAGLSAALVWELFDQLESGVIDFTDWQAYDSWIAAALDDALRGLRAR